ncbi:ADP-ribosylglycohydrolase family protein [Streptomonospora wellingtoniae]|uniref:ADP-ribosylglycohydrolase family protein n=1 Tax=Streptomonospora wellingtoniae TaxID=3075544 RepID=A0ABU2KYK0_9ACTN|nr:ADP-ribosylglycohydrolase family protein [Streptomonospora sp. DSM 45055]MDT0304222.1 ADP-ribosylglycohydrolase family protein [Streptomonospora sp. DSM 45055]
MSDTRSPEPTETERRDRAAGVLLGAACGDALGVPYEFAARLGPETRPEMVGGGLGPYRPGEYSDDTQMAACIARAFAGAPHAGADGASGAEGAGARAANAPGGAEGGGAVGGAALDAVADNFLTWMSEGASDIGNQTRAVLGAAVSKRGAPGVAEAMLAAARDRYEAGVPSAGNGSLMRTGPVGLCFPDDPQRTADAARLISRLTHADPLAEEACVLWCEGVRRAVLGGGFEGVHAGLDLLPADRRDHWAARLAEAEQAPPHAFNPNGFVVTALQAAWSAITAAQGEGADHLVAALENAVRAGDDTDTVAAIAGALLGARWGASAVPARWRASVHGWPGLSADDLEDLGRTLAPAPLIL